MASEVQEKHKVSKIDVADFCGIDDLETISEYGLEVLFQKVLKETAKGWTFIECNRDESRPTLVYLHFIKK